MAGLSTGLKAKLTIRRCDVDDKGKVTPRTGGNDAFELMLNPAEFTQENSTSFSVSSGKEMVVRAKIALGQTVAEPRFSAINAGKITFDAVIDATGVVNLPDPGVDSPDGVNAQIKKLKAVAYDFEGDIHEPPVVRLSWGKLDLSHKEGRFIYARLETLSVKYTLFKPSGEPLRARVSMGFVGFMTLEEGALRAEKSSPDLSHLVEVCAGDTLPLLCQRIYKDSRQHLVVARANRLSNFRDLKPGTVLRFPPLD